MSCETWQSAISARLDGEDPGVEPRMLDAHLTTCVACREFAATASAGRRAAHLQPAPDITDVSRDVVRVTAMADRAARSWGVRLLLFVMAAVIVGFAMKDLISGHETATAEHAARHLGAFTVAYGAGLLVVVVRPARARTVLPVSMVLAGALAITSLIDILEHKVPLVDETIHIPELASVLLVWLLAVPAHGPRARRLTPAPRLVAVADASAVGGPTDLPADRSAGRRMRRRSSG
jgi:predicted anti-sigma-YlaC factor YlaD